MKPALKDFSPREISALIDAAEALIKDPDLSPKALSSQEGLLAIAAIQGQRDLIRKMRSAVSVAESATKRAM